MRSWGREEVGRREERGGRREEAGGGRGEAEKKEKSNSVTVRLVS